MPQTQMPDAKRYKRGLQRLTTTVRDEVDVAGRLRDIASGKVDIGICLRELAHHAKAQALLAWFGAHDLEGCKRWAYVCAKLRCLIFKHWPYDSFHVYDHLMPLVSDCAPLVEWLSHCEAPYSRHGYYSNPQRTGDPSKPDFTDYNVLLALRGEWTLLAQRSEQLLTLEATRRQSYRADHRFFLGLAHSDRAAMEDALAELVAPGLRARRTYDDESSVTRRLLCTNAVVYAKIAARHGHALTIESPWVPAAWLPIRPLDDYPDPYPFMRSFQAPLPLHAVT